MENIPLTQDQINMIRDLFMQNKDAVIAAHNAMVWSEYSTSNRDVSILVDYVDNVAINPFYFDKFRGDPDNPVTYKTRSVEFYSPLMMNLSRACTAIANHPKVLYTSIHVLDAEKHAVSFEDHTDPVDVIMITVKGTKGVILTDDAGQESLVTLEEGDVLYVPHGLVHRIDNTHASIMLSIGLERYTEEHIAHGNA